MRLGRLFGIEVVVNPYFVLLIGLYALAGILLQGLLAFAVVIIHEVAHIIAAYRLGMKVTEVELLPFGGVARLDSFIEMDPEKEIKVALAGPLSNILMLSLVGGGFVLGLLEHPLIFSFLKINLMLLIFNLLPILPLDGGRVYRALLISKVGIKEATEAAAGHGMIATGMLGFLGIIGVFKGLTGFDFLITVCFLAYVSSREGNKAMYLFMRYITRKKEELAQQGILPVEEYAVMGHIPVRKLMKHIIPKKFCLITVVATDLKIMGMLTEGDIIEGILNMGIDVPVQDFLT